MGQIPELPSEGEDAPFRHTDVPFSVVHIHDKDKIQEFKLMHRNETLLDDFILFLVQNHCKMY